MLARRITQLRQQGGLTQAQLSKKLNISASAIGMYEQGRRVPGLEILVALSGIFGVSLDYLITGQEYSGRAEAQKPRAMCLCVECRCRRYD